MKNVIKEIESRVNEVLEKADASIKDEQEQLSKLDESSARYEQEMENAVKDGDTKAYKSAQSKLEDVNFQKKYHQSRLKSFTEGHLIEEAEYNKMVADLMLYLRQKSDAAIMNTVNLLKEERNKADALKNEIHAANALMKTLQHKIYREDVYRKDAQGNTKIGKVDGKPVVDTNKLKSFNDFDYINWIYDLTYVDGNEAGSDFDKMRRKVSK